MERTDKVTDNIFVDQYFRCLKGHSNDEKELKKKIEICEKNERLLMETKKKLLRLHEF